MSDIISTETMMQSFSEFLDPSSAKISSVWKKIVSRIKSLEDKRREAEKTEQEEYSEDLPLGEKLAQNTHVVDLKKGVLLVEANHSGWIQYLRMYQKYILTGFKKECPDIKINSLAFRTRGSDVKLFDDYEELLKQSLQKRKEEIEKTEKQVQAFYENNGEEDKTASDKEITDSEFRDRIKGLYDAFDESMLTNSDK